MHPYLQYECATKASDDGLTCFEVGCRSRRGLPHVDGQGKPWPGTSASPALSFLLQLLGLDVLIDEDLRPWLIEVRPGSNTWQPATRCRRQPTPSTLAVAICRLLSPSCFPAPLMLRCVTVLALDLVAAAAAGQSLPLPVNRHAPGPRAQVAPRPVRPERGPAYPVPVTHQDAAFRRPAHLGVHSVCAGRCWSWLACRPSAYGPRWRWGSGQRASWAVLQPLHQARQTPQQRLEQVPGACRKVALSPPGRRGGAPSGWRRRRRTRTPTWASLSASCRPRIQNW
jgi:hypothetical protein